MSSILDNVQPAVKKETKRVVKITAVGLILMWILFAVLHFTMPDKVPLDYTVFLGGIGGGAVAVLNFFLMGLAVQKAQSKLLPENADSDVVGDPGNRRTVLPFCCRNCSTFISGNGNKDHGDIS